MAADARGGGRQHAVLLDAAHNPQGAEAKAAIAKFLEDMKPHVAKAAELGVIFSAVVDANLTAAFRVVKRASQGMLRARKGRIILMSSVVGLLGSAGQANYAASKAGLVGFARSLARELGSRSITVNVVAPVIVSVELNPTAPTKVVAPVTVSVEPRLTAPESVVVPLIASAPRLRVCPPVPSSIVSR